MIGIRSVTRRLLSNIKTQQQILRAFSAADIQAQKDDTPVHLKPYNPEKYEVVGKGLKTATGYSYLDVEPFPRARLMKLGYLILDRIKGAPEDSNLRLWYEEYAKWMMEVVDQTESVVELEEKIGTKLTQNRPLAPDLSPEG